MPDSPARTCPTCATAIPASFPEGFCPKCMLASATPAAVEAAEGDKTLAVPAPTPSQMLRPGGVPSVEMLRRIFSDLEILDVLGAGGMSAVYKARQPRLNRLVALKIMVAEPGHETDFALRFEREAQVLARLSHPHIVILYDFGELGTERTGADPLFYFLMEYVDGTDLGQLIKSKELQPAQALAIVPQICEALQYAHDQGITHRDIKPANILIDKRGVVKIADFGLAKMVGGGTEEALMTGLTQTGTAMGTPHYMAPEQWEHPQQVDHRADIYALGVVFYEMLTGERPAGVFEPPSKKTKPPVDKKLDGVVMRAMDKNPDRRYQQAGQIGDDVTRISGANKSRPATTKGTSEPKRSPLKPLLAIGIAATLAVGGWMLWQGGQAGPPAAAVPPNAALGVPSALPATTAPKHEWAMVDWPGQTILVGGNTSRKVTREEIAKDGGLSLVKEELWIANQVPRIGKVQNGGIRLRWKRLSEKGNFNVFMRGERKAKVSLWGNGASIFHGGANDEFKLGGLPHGGLAPVGQEMLMEIVCVGRLLILKRDGVIQDTRELPEAAPADFLRFQGSWVIVTQAELINLDGLSETESLKLAGVSEAKHLAVTVAAEPGRLRASGAMMNGKPPEIAKFAAHEDFVDVAGGADHWMALRANGETVSSDGKADFTGIRKIAHSYAGYHCFIEKAGGLRFHPMREMALPDRLKGEQIVDAACGSHHGVALLERGQAVVFGKRYEEAMEDVNQAQGLGTPCWPQPEAAALQNVKGVAVTQTHAATLHHDGTVSVWGWEGPVKWQPEPEMKPVRQISSFHDSLHLLDEADQVWSFPLPRSAHPEQPVGFDGRVKLLGKDAVRLRDHLWLNANGAWRATDHDRLTVETLESATLKRETNFTLLASSSNAIPFGYVLWIEKRE